MLLIYLLNWFLVHVHLRSSIISLILISRIPLRNLLLWLLLLLILVNKRTISWHTIDNILLRILIICWRSKWLIIALLGLSIWLIYLIILLRVILRINVSSFKLRGWSSLLLYKIKILILHLLVRIRIVLLICFYSSHLSWLIATIYSYRKSYIEVEDSVIQFDD